MQESENNFSLKSEELNWKDFGGNWENKKNIVGKEKNKTSPEKRQKKAIFAQKILSFYR